MISSTAATFINHLLARESWAREQFARHAGKTACLDAGVVALRLRVASDGMLHAADDAVEANVTIRVKPADLPLIMQDRARAFSYVQIEGDADFANAISTVSQSLQWEVEEDLARWVGDIAATRLVAGARDTVQTVRATHRSLAENLAEYFLDEQAMLVRPHAVADYADEVARLRDDVERLSKRIEKLGS